ncbi:MAG: hypothetical protein M0Q38_10625 [Bacteroidales bacterium]|nr:hypothetical protein [Bacteroidales bacterium]
MLGSGIMVFRDYGISWDENTQRNSGIVFINHIQKTFDIKPIRLSDRVPKLEDYQDKEFGAAFEVLLFATERLFQFKDYREVFFFRHLVNFLVFWMGVTVFAFVIKNRFENWFYPLIACLILFLHPRIFAESFYNSKDIIVMVFFIFSFYSFVRLSQTGLLRHVMLLAFLSAITFNVRPVGILIPFLVFILLLPRFVKYPILPIKRRRHFINLMLLPVLFLFFVLATNPYLWSDPFGRTYAIIVKFLNYDVSHTAGNILFLGKYIPTNQVPWYYLPLWIGISTPLVYLVFSMAGMLIALIRVLRMKSEFFNQDYSTQDLFVAGWLLVPIIIAILFHSTLYDGWRHFYFLWPAIVYFAIYFLKSFIAYLDLPGKTWKTKAWKLLLFFVVGGTFLANIQTVIHNHPHQYCYFNVIAPEPSDNFELDYWGLSYRDALEHLVRADPADTLSVKVLNLPGYLNAFLLKPEERHRVWFDYSLRENYSIRIDSYYPFPSKPNELLPGKGPVYYISNFRDPSSPDELIKYRKHEYPYINQVYSLKYGQMEIMGIYKLR